jgi:hypothetical protein
MSLKHFSIFEEDDGDPMLSSINLVDVFLVLVVALMAAVNVSSAGEAGTPVELTLPENGKEIRYQGTGDQGDGEGVRAGVAYRLRDGSIIYVPEAAAAKP